MTKIKVIKDKDGNEITLEVSDGDFGLIIALENLTKSIDILRNTWKR